MIGVTARIFLLLGEDIVLLGGFMARYETQKQAEGKASVGMVNT